MHTWEGCQSSFRVHKFPTKKIGITNNYVRETNMMTKQVKMTGNMVTFSDQISASWGKCSKSISMHGMKVAQKGLNLLTIQRNQVRESSAHLSFNFRSFFRRHHYLSKKIDQLRNQSEDLLASKGKNKTSKKSFLGKQEFKQPVSQFYIELGNETKYLGI